jgi:hypothetical protein
MAKIISQTDIDTLNSTLNIVGNLIVVANT